MGSHDHVCWTYDNTADLGHHVAEFLVDGLRRGQRVCYVGSGDTEALTAAVRRVDGLQAALVSGAARVASVTETYPSGAVIDPEHQVRAYAAATEQALAAGYQGLRVAAEATPLVRSQAQLTAFLHYEHLIDHYMAGHPFSALCAYDSTLLGERAVAQLAGVHPNTNPPGAGFRLHASARPGHSAQLSGELDMANRDVLVEVLNRTRPPSPGGRLVLDAAGLTFIDHRSMVILADYARSLATTLVLRTDFLGAARIATLMDLPELRVEPVA